MGGVVIGREREIAEANGFLADIGFGRATYHLARVDGYGDNLLAFMSDYPAEWLTRYARHVELVRGW